MVAGPDLGTAIMLLMTAAILFYVAGLERRYVVVAAGGGVLLIAALIAGEALPAGASGGAVRSRFQDYRQDQSRRADPRLRKTFAGSYAIRLISRSNHASPWAAAVFSASG